MSHWDFEEDYFEVDENFNFNEGINKLLDGEVEKRLAEKIKGYESAIKREKESRATIQELKASVRDLKESLDNSEKAFKKEGKDEALREMLGGYKLGDEVWFHKGTYIREDCGYCKGLKKVTATIAGEEVKITCPVCNGNGWKSRTEQSVERGIIKEIEIHTWYHGEKFELSMYVEPASYRNSDSMRLRKDQIFKTEEECEKAL